MSKEAMAGEVCNCGQRIAFMQYHFPHCKMNPINLGKFPADISEPTARQERVRRAPKKAGGRR